MRAALLALLALAVVDPSLPGAGPRRRVYLVDVSASVARASGADAFTPEDALRLASHDVKSMRPEDEVALVAFGAKPAVIVPLSPASKVTLPVRIDGVDRSSTDLVAALDMANALAEGGDIILFSDGRSTTGRVPVERIRAPVHVFALGPVGGVDASIAAIDAPVSAAPGAPARIRITVGTTGPWRGELVAGGERRALEFTGPGRQDVILVRDMPRDGPALEVPLKLAGPAADPCPENDAATVTVWRESRALRVLVVSPDRQTNLSGVFREPDWISSWAPDLSSAAEADVIIIERLRGDAVSRADLERLARLVREDGAGLVMMGGSSAFALGGWGGTPVEEVLPFWAFPDERSAVAIVLDRSGSMAEPAPSRSRPRIEDAAAAVRRTLQLVHDDDEVALVTFADAPELRCPLVQGRERGRAAAALEKVSAGGPTALAPALSLAAATVKLSKAGRRRIVLVTDGRSVDEEAEIRSIANLLKEDSIGLLVVRTGDATTPALEILAAAGARVMDGSRVLLDGLIEEALARSLDLTIAPTRLTFTGPLSASSSGIIPRLVNRVSMKPGSEVLVTSNEGPRVAVRPAGRGRVAASTLSFEEGWAPDLAAWRDADAFVRWLAASVAPPAAGLPAEVSARFEDERLEITAALRGPDRPDRIEVHLDGAAVGLVRRGENTYVKTLSYLSTTAAVRIGGRIAAVARRPHPPEFDVVGPDTAALDALARATGGTRIESPRDLTALPGRGPSRPQSSRTLLLAAALAVFLLDVVLGLLWRH